MQCTNRSMPWATDGVDKYFYHGTHVASVVGAVQNNTEGVTGVANGVKIMVLRVRRGVDGCGGRCGRVWGVDGGVSGGA